MGTTGSSSKRRSSSSLKKKRSKNTYEVRKRKRSSRRNKSGKSRRRDDSISYSDEDDSGSSTSSVSYSSSTSEDDRRRRRSRSRSRTRRNVKGSRKRDRTRSSSRENSIRAKKRKGLRRNGNSDARKKSSKKKSRRDVSLSSARSRSWSCSTCRGGGSSSDESEFERPKGRSDRKGRDKKREGKVNGGTRRGRHRSRSPSSSSSYGNGGGYHSEERPMIENSSRRLKSIITYAKEADEKEGRELDKDEGKEEMVYDHDDYPCRSGDSNDGGSKKESTYNSYVVSEKKRQGENENGAGAFVSQIRTTGNESGKVSGDKHEGSNHRLVVVQAGNLSEENKREVPSGLHNPNGDDLESILRQKALENLRKFRFQGNTKASADLKDGSDGKVKQLSPAKAELGRWKPPQEDDNRVGGMAPAVDHAIMPKMGVDSFLPSQNEDEILKVKRSVLKSVVAKQDIVSPADQVAVSGNIKEKMNSTAGAITGKSELGTVSLRQKSLSTSSATNQVPASHIPKANLLVNRSSVYNSSVETSQTVPLSSNNRSVEVSNARDSAVPKPSSSLKSAPRECNTKEPQDQTKEGSQFEQKTMSVMRGGEMVQVSYKVYIPKKAPGLGRRQLQR